MSNEAIYHHHQEVPYTTKGDIRKGPFRLPTRTTVSGERIMPFGDSDILITTQQVKGLFQKPKFEVSVHGFVKGQGLGISGDGLTIVERISDRKQQEQIVEMLSNAGWKGNVRFRID